MRKNTGSRRLESVRCSPEQNYFCFGRQGTDKYPRRRQLYLRLQKSGIPRALKNPRCNSALLFLLK